MTAHEMSGLLLDGQINVDANGMGALETMDTAMGLDEVDLFGDPVISRPPPSNALRHRLDELRTRGCCQAIAWSRQGTIASVSKDGTSIDLRFLRCHPDTGDWDLSIPNPFSPGPSAVPIVHLAWAPTSSPELAVIDAVGRIIILCFSITLNKPYYSRRWDSDVIDDVHAVVGCHWLPLLIPPNRLVGGRRASIPDHDVPPSSLCRSSMSCTGQLSGPSQSTSSRIPSPTLPALGIPMGGRAPCCVSPQVAFSNCYSPKTTTASKKPP